jgi:5-methyltetrahydrofolate--homocysteine methyltransferase
MVNLSALTAAIEAGDRTRSVAVTQEAIAAGSDPQEVLRAMTTAMDAVGGRFQRNEIYVPEMLISARAMMEATSILEPVLVAAGIQPDHTAVIGTIKGDLHDIGKNLVAMMWRGANIRVVDLGTNVPPDRFAEAVKEHHADLVGISALLTTTMVGMREAVEVIRRSGIDGVSVIVGGAPLTQKYADEIGADGYAPDAGSSADVARQLLARVS